nr:MAG TPA: hypothetical protein [Caudoviricetes sp.]
MRSDSIIRAFFIAWIISLRSKKRKCKPKNET